MYLVYETNSIGLCCELCIDTTIIVGLYDTLEKAKSVAKARIKSGIIDGFIENEKYNTEFTTTMCYQEKNNIEQSFDIVIKEMVVE